MNKKIIKGGIVSTMFAFFFLIFASCENEETGSEISQKVDVGALGSGNACTPLLAGQNINVGTVCFADIDTNNDGVVDALTVTYNTINGWTIADTHLWVGSSLSQLPTNNGGNPIPGQFPYKSGVLSAGLTTYSVTIPFTTLGFTCPGPGKYYVAAHAVVKKPGVSNETAWGNGNRITSRGSWANYTTIYITCEEVEEEVEVDCETAFAYSSTYGSCFSSFSDLIPNSNRWGWSNGPLSPGNYTFDLYAGAGQCNLSNGTLVGNLTVNYNGSTALVRYNIVGTNPVTNMPYTLDEAHLYVGNDVLPSFNGGYTVAPGQYPITNLSANGEYTINNLSGNIYVVAHAVVCGFPKQ